MTPPIYYLIKQATYREAYKYVWYLNPYQASLHNSPDAVKPVLQTDKPPEGVEGVDYLICYSNHDR